MSMILECVPNFSEGRNDAILEEIAETLRSVQGVKLLHMDKGWSANRTVMTFAGVPDQVVEAAFRAVKKAAELIDMSTHQGTHPRFGATDVLPLVPVSGISMDETVVLARKLAQRIGKELGIPVYCYENAAFSPDRRDLAKCRAGQYEGLEAKMSSPDGIPDFGPKRPNKRSGAIAIGARDFLVAYNINLDTRDVRIAKDIAETIRETGKVLKQGGVVLRDEQGFPRRMPGMFKHVKAIGWYIPEFEKCQVSTNLTGINHTSMHQVFVEVQKLTLAKGTRVTGSEIVGLVPLKCLVEAGRIFASREGKTIELPKEDLVDIAVRSLGLGDVCPFDPKQKILEWRLEDQD
jgi:glutamate formiminotransferase / formiminotetrahydrofolate cyclodeaminase